MVFRWILRVVVMAAVAGLAVRPGAGPLAHAASCAPVASPGAEVSPSGGFANASQVIATFDTARSKEGCTVALSIDPTAYDAASPQTQMLMLFNAERRDRGLGTLTLDPNLLSQISLNHSREMVQYGYFNHPSPINHPGITTTAIFGRITVNPAVSGHYTNVAENIAAGYTPVAAAVYTYMYQDSQSSWGHRHNILGWDSNTNTFGAFNYAGIGIANGGSYGVYYTDDFLQSSPSSPYVPPTSADTQAPGMNPPTIASGSPGGTVTAQVTGVSDAGACCGEAGVTGVVFYAGSITMDAYGNANTVVASQSSPGVWTASLSLPAGSTLHAVAVDGSGNFDDCAMGASVCQVAPAHVSSLALSAPATAVAGTPFSVTVTAKDNYNQTYTVYTGTVHFSSSDPRASLPTDYTFTAGDAGSHTFSLALNTAGPQTFTVTDTSNSTLTVTSGTITVSPGPTARLFVSGPGTTVAGNAASVTVTAQDAYGNTTPGYTGTVHFTSSDPQAILPANYTYTGADNGTHSFSVTLKTAGSQTVTASDTSSSSLSGSVTISVSPAAAQSLVLTAPSSAAAGSPLNVSVTALDPYGNLATGYRGTLHFTSTDPAASISLPANSTFTASDAGSHVFSATLQTLGTQTITATDTGNGSLAGTTPAITISAAPLTVPLVVSTGWNLIGGTPVTVYPDATAAWSWNATSGQWSSMSQGAQPSLPLGEGTWEELRGGTSEQVQVEGCTASVAISVFPHRWNMVGNPCNVPVTLPAGSRALGWTPSSQSYQPITQLPAGGAAWVVPPSSVLSLTP